MCAGLGRRSLLGVGGISASSYRMRAFCRDPLAATRHRRRVRMLALAAAILATLAAAASGTAAASRPQGRSAPPKRLWYRLSVTYSGDVHKVQSDTGGPTGMSTSNANFRTSWQLHSTGTNGTDSVLVRRNLYGARYVYHGEVTGAVTQYQADEIVQFLGCPGVDAQTTVAGTAKLSGTISPLSGPIQQGGLSFATKARGDGKYSYSGYTTCQGRNAPASDGSYPIGLQYVWPWSTRTRVRTRFVKGGFEVVVSDHFNEDYSTTCCLGIAMGSQKLVETFVRCPGTAPC